MDLDSSSSFVTCLPLTKSLIFSKFLQFPYCIGKKYYFFLVSLVFETRYIAIFFFNDDLQNITMW